MKKKTIQSPLLLLVLLCSNAHSLDQSKTRRDNDEPMEMQEFQTGGLDLAPEVVLQLKYDKGELNRIYLAQFRKGKQEWAPSVHARSNLCADLCYAGLGGDACGSACMDLIPVGLKTALNGSVVNDDQFLGEPRTAVCPTLCANKLGKPLCSCGALETEIDHVNWTSICDVFCVSDRYVLGGCPVCDTTSTQGTSGLGYTSRILTTNEGWSAWCDVQCRQGQGGAACNCDRAPFQ